MSVTLRAKGADVIVRGGGRWVRITREWMRVSDYTFERIDAQARKLIEVREGHAPLVVDTRPPAPDPDIATHPAPPDEEPPSEAAGEPEREEAETSSSSPAIPADASGASSDGSEAPTRKRRGRRKKHTTRGDAQ